MTEAAADAVLRFFVDARGGEPAPLSVENQPMTRPIATPRPPSAPPPGKDADSPAEDVVEHAAAAELTALAVDESEDDLARSVAELLTDEAAAARSDSGS